MKLISKLSEKVENKRKEVREGIYRIQLYKFHPKVGLFSRKLFLWTCPTIIVLLVMMFVTRNPDPELGMDLFDAFLFGIIILVGAFGVFAYLLVSPPSCSIEFDEKIGDKHHHEAIAMLYDYLGLAKRKIGEDIFSEDDLPIETQIHVKIVNEVTNILDVVKDKTNDFNARYIVTITEDEASINLLSGNFPLDFPESK